MQRFVSYFWILNFLLFCVCISSFAQNNVPEITGIRFGEHAHKTRFVIDLTDRVEFHAFTLQNPERVVIDLPALQWGAVPKTSNGRGLISRYRSGITETGTARLVLDTAQPVKLEKSFVLPATAKNPFRVVLDVIPDQTKDISSPLPLIKPEPVSATFPTVQNIPSAHAPKPPVKKTAKKIIMIDPGHGGNDPGAISRSGLLEKQVVLSFSRILRRELESTGRYKVIMTRDSDVYIKLRDRVKKSRAAKADLFLSIHADSAPNVKAIGASIYTLSETSSDKETARLAARENRSDIIAGVDLNEEENEVANILIDLAMRESMNQSKQFANLVVDRLEHADLTTVKNAHRSAGFAVLKAPDVPSVLIELGYLSNRREAKRLVNKNHKKRIARSLTNAINLYFDRLQQAENY